MPFSESHEKYDTSVFLRTNKSDSKREKMSEWEKSLYAVMFSLMRLRIGHSILSNDLNILLAFSIGKTWRHSLTILWKFNMFLWFHVSGFAKEKAAQFKRWRYKRQFGFIPWTRRPKVPKWGKILKTKNYNE